MKDFRSKGLKWDACLTIVDLSKNQFYYISIGHKLDKRLSLLIRFRDPKTLKEEIMTENQMNMAVTALKTNPHHGYWYRLITKTLQINSCFVNYKKVFWLMTRHVLLEYKKVFTHPYTPEENAHVESFNKTLGKAIGFNP